MGERVLGPCKRDYLYKLLYLITRELFKYTKIAII